MPSEDSDFVPEIAPDETTGEMVDVRTQKKYVKPFKQKEYKPQNEYEG